MICITDCQNCGCLQSPCEGAENAVLKIGTGEASTDYTIYIQNDSTGRTERVSVTSDPSGLITLDMVAVNPSFFHPNANYFLWVTLEGADMVAQEIITIDALEYTCFKFSFNRSFVDGAVEVLPIQNLTPVL